MTHYAKGMKKEHAQASQFCKFTRGPHFLFHSQTVRLSLPLPGSWRERKALQQPNYPDKSKVESACSEIAQMPPLVFAGEARTLQQRLAKVSPPYAFP